MCQVMILILSLTSIILLTSKSESVKRWGSVAGLCSQPFWLYATWNADQGGMFLLSITYTILWVRAIRNGFSNQQKGDGK